MLIDNQLACLDSAKGFLATKDQAIFELRDKLEKLVTEKEHKLFTLKASQDKQSLQTLLEPCGMSISTKQLFTLLETEQDELRVILLQLEEEKRHKIQELKVLREEKKKLKRLNSQKEDLEER